MPGLIDVRRVEVPELTAGDPAVLGHVQVRQKVGVLVAVEEVDLERLRTVNLFVGRERLAVTFGRLRTVARGIARRLTRRHRIGRCRVRILDGLRARGQEQKKRDQRESIHESRVEQTAYPPADGVSAA